MLDHGKGSSFKGSTEKYESKDKYDGYNKNRMMAEKKESLKY